MSKEILISNPPDIFQSPAVYKKAPELRVQWNEYLASCIDDKKMPTKAGVCFALKIHRKEWESLRNHATLGIAIDWIETVIEDTWLQQLIRAGSGGALAYLKSHYPEQYGEVALDKEAPVPILNLSIHYTAVQNNKS